MDIVPGPGCFAEKRGEFGLEFHFVKQGSDSKYQLVFLIYARFTNRDVDILFVSFFRRSNRYTWCGFLTKQQQCSMEGSACQHFKPSRALHFESKPSTWPQDVQEYEELIGKALEVFLPYIENGANHLGN